MKIILITMSLVGVLLSLPGFAETPNFKTHSFGLELSGGDAKYKGSSADGDGVAHIYTYYNYSFTPQIALELGVLGGAEVDAYDCHRTGNPNDETLCRTNNALLFNTSANQLDYNSFVVAAKGELAISKRNSLYAKVGGQFYQHELSRDSVKLEDNDGFGAYLEAGWKFEWKSGWGINAGYQYLDMDELKLSNLNFGASYSF